MIVTDEMVQAALDSYDTNRNYAPGTSWCDVLRIDMRRALTAALAVSVVPELVAALEALLARVECGTALHCDLCDAARAALARAKGETR